MIKKLLLMSLFLFIGLTLSVYNYGINSPKLDSRVKAGIIKDLLKTTLLLEHNVPGSIENGSYKLPVKILLSTKEMSGNDYLA
jgi:hypothetical protein